MKLTDYTTPAKWMLMFRNEIILEIMFRNERKSGKVMFRNERKSGKAMKSFRMWASCISK
jgi:hypothetical protein